MWFSIKLWICQFMTWIISALVSPSLILLLGGLAYLQGISHFCFYFLRTRIVNYAKHGELIILTFVADLKIFILILSILTKL